MEMLINGSWVQSCGNKKIPVSNPANGEVIDYVPMGEKLDVELALDACQKGKVEIASMPAFERYNILLRIGEDIRQHAKEISIVLTKENGKPLAQSESEVIKTGQIFTGFGEQTKRVLGNTFPMDSIPGCYGQMGMTIRQPLGVVAAIIPFNFPAAIFAHKVAPALAAGNAVIVKPSRDCPLSDLKIAEIVLKAGIPPSAFHVITGYGGEVGEALVKSEMVDMVTFTGSTETGKLLIRESATSIKRFCLELGGNDPLIVFDDADLDEVVKEVIRARLVLASGQTCYAAKRVIIQDTIKDIFAEMLVVRAKELKLGNPLEDGVEVGPLINEEAAKNVEGIISDSIEQGARCLTGGKRFNRTFFEPTVLDEVGPKMRVVAEETFGPVVPIMSFSSQEEAIELANRTPYGLHGGVYTNDISRAFDVAYRLEVGGVAINGSGCFHPGNMPFSPFKQSGFGNEGIFHSIEEMTHIKSILINHALSSYNGK